MDESKYFIIGLGTGFVLTFMAGTFYTSLVVNKIMTKLSLPLQEETDNLENSKLIRAKNLLQGL